jgi:Holliday junction resolvase RusA-like endonuclease
MNKQLPLIPPEPVYSIKITVPGEPVAWGRARARIVTPRFKKPFIHFFQDSETEQYKARIAKAAMIVMAGRGIVTGALEMRIGVYMPIRESWTKKKQHAAYVQDIAPVTKPDWDNFGKICGDALNKVVYHDDCQIVEAHVSKRYSDNPRLEIEVLPA